MDIPADVTLATTNHHHLHHRRQSRHRYRVPPSAAHHDIGDRHPSATSTSVPVPVDADDVAVSVDAELDFLDDDDFGVPINVHDDDLLNFDDDNDDNDDNDDDVDDVDVYHYDSDANSITTLTPPSSSSPAAPASLPAAYIPRFTTNSASYRPPRPRKPAHQARMQTQTQAQKQTQDASFLTNGAATPTATTASMSTGGSSSITTNGGGGSLLARVGAGAAVDSAATVAANVTTMMVDVDEPASLPLFNRLPDRHEMHFHFQQPHHHHHSQPHHPQHDHSSKENSSTIHFPPRHPKPSHTPDSHTSTNNTNTTTDDEADAEDIHGLVPVAARALADVLRGTRSDDASQQQHTHSQFPSPAYDGGSANRLYRSVDLDLDVDRDLLHLNSGVVFPSSPREPRRTRTWTRARRPRRASLPEVEGVPVPAAPKQVFETDVDVETAWDAFINAMADCGPLARPDHRTVLIALMRATRYVLGIRTLIPWYSDVGVSAANSAGGSNAAAAMPTADSGGSLKPAAVAAVAAAFSGPQQTVSDDAASVVFLQGLGAASAVCDSGMNGAVAVPCDIVTATATGSAIAPAAAEAHVDYGDDAASAWGENMSTASGASTSTITMTRLANARFLKRFLFALSSSSSSSSATGKPGTAALTVPPAFDHPSDVHRRRHNHSHSHPHEHTSKPRCAPHYRQRRNEVNMNVHLSFALTVVAVHAALARVGCEVTLLTPYAATSAAVSHIPAAAGAGVPTAVDSPCASSGRASVSTMESMGDSMGSFLGSGDGGSGAAVSGQRRLSLRHRRDDREANGRGKYSRQCHRRRHRKQKRQRHNNDCPTPQSRSQQREEQDMPGHGQHILPEMGAVTEASFNVRTTCRGAKIAFTVAFEHDAPCRVSFHHPGILAVRNAARFAEVVAEVRRLVESFERSVRAWGCARRAVAAAAQTDANRGRL